MLPLHPPNWPPSCVTHLLCTLQLLIRRSPTSMELKPTLSSTLPLHQISRSSFVQVMQHMQMTLRLARALGVSDTSYLEEQQTGTRRSRRLSPPPALRPSF